jgi:hypothetical protein
MIFLELKKDIPKKKKINFFIGYSNSEFLALSLKKIISSLAHRELAQICIGSATRSIFAERKTSAVHCMQLLCYIHVKHSMQKYCECVLV